MATRRLRPEDVADDIKKQQKYLTDASAHRKLNRKVIGPVMVTGVILRFLSGKGPNGKEWLSGAKSTRLGGRYSAAYKTRPSGRDVSAGSVRNADTGALANTHKVINSNQYRVLVGPDKEGKSGKARKIMKREADYGNYAVGWDKALLRVLASEKQAYIDEIAMGKVPRYLPKSRIRERV